MSKYQHVVTGIPLADPVQPPKQILCDMTLAERVNAAKSMQSIQIRQNNLISEATRTIEINALYDAIIDKLHNVNVEELTNTITIIREPHVLYQDLDGYYNSDRREDLSKQINERLLEQHKLRIEISNVVPKLRSIHKLCYCGCDEKFCGDEWCSDCCCCMLWSVPGACLPFIFYWLPRRNDQFQLYRLALECI